MRAFTGSDRFELLEEIGRGAMGVVYRALDREEQREVALKTFQGPDPDRFAELKREFRTVAGLYHPNLVELGVLESDDSHCFFTMELVVGSSFVEFVGAGRPSPTERASRIADVLPQLVSAISALHDAGVRHADIKPSNVLVTSDRRAVLLDFGLAGRLGRSDSFAGGTWPYMAPELAYGASTAAADWYGLGVLLYEAAAGWLPFDASVAAGLRAKEAGDFSPLRSDFPEMPAWLDELVAELLAPDPARRPSGAALRRRFPASTPLPVSRARLSFSGSAPFVGRIRELEQLGEAFDVVSGGKGALVHVVGPSGIGKSALVEHFLEELEDSSAATVLRAHCNPREMISHNALDSPIDDLIRASTRRGGEGIRRPRHAGALLRIFPALARIPGFAGPMADAGEEPLLLRQLAGDALGELLHEAGSSRPVVLVIDDAHWADSDSASLLRIALNHAPAPNILVVLAYRAEDADASPLLRIAGEQLLVHPSCEIRRVTLGPIAPAELQLLARALTSREGDPELAREEEIAASQGSPFLLAELIRDRTARAGAGEPDAASLAGGVDAIVSRRLASLDEKARLLLGLVAVAGAPLARDVAIEAAELELSAAPTLRRLEGQSLLRLADHGSSIAVYHDRIGQSLLNLIGPEGFRRCSRSLAETLERSPDAPAHLLAQYHHGAGDVQKAGGFAESAAAEAASQLAFDRAASLYERALDWLAPAGEDRLRLLSRLAEARFNAGRCRDAAPAYLDASDLATGAERRRLQSRAVEALLVSGDVELGIEQAKAALAELDLGFPASPTRAAFSVLGQLALVATRGSHFARPTSEPELCRARADLCWSLAKGLLYVLPLEGSHFMLRSLRESLRCGDPERLGRALAFAGAGLFSQIPLLAPQGRRYLDRVDALAALHASPLLEGMALVWRAFSGLYYGDWSSIVDRAERGLSVLQEKCAGTSWERVVAGGLSVLARQWMGDLRSVREMAMRRTGEAGDLGDRYGEVLFRQNAAFCDLAAGDTASARAQLEWIREHWTSRPTVPQFYCWIYELYADLYEGSIDGALERFVGFRPLLRRHGAYRVPMSRIDVLLLEGRLALCAGAERANRYTLRSPGEVARRLAREVRPDGAAHAALLRAGAASWERNPDAATRELEQGIQIYDRMSMGLFAASARFQRALVLGDAAGRAAAEAALLACGVADPRAWSAVFAPGNYKTL